MSKPIHFDKFTGMNTVDRTSPVRIIQNMDNTKGGRLEMRPGCELWHQHAGSHSLFSDGSNLFFVAQGETTPEALYQITRDKQLTLLTAITGLGATMHYVHAAGRLFISSRFWNGVYEYGSGIRPWGAEYSNDPADYAGTATSEEWMFQGGIRAPYMEHLAQGGGRIFGAVGSRIYYNDPPFAYEVFKPDSFYDMPEVITMIACAKEGVYFASEKATWFAQGFDPEQWVMTRIADGALAGSLQWVENYKEFGRVPVWFGRSGVQVGVQGSMVKLTDDRVKPAVTSGEAASFYDNTLERYIVQAKMPEMGFADMATADVFRNGKLITN